MNQTKIDWADKTWNPVTGCLHNCPYCYARKIANRFKSKSHYEYVDGIKPPHLKEPFPYGFLPTLHPDRLGAPGEIERPQLIFVGSMTDLFGESIPDEWIASIMGICKNHSQHQYFFLTKNPKRYEELLYKGILANEPNFWYGSTITSHEENIFKKTVIGEGGHFQTFVSIEPLMSHWPDESCNKLSDIQWVIVGIETGNRKDRAIIEKRSIEKIAKECSAASVPLFMKESLRGLMGQNFRQESPKNIKKG